MIARRAIAIGAAVERPVVENREVAIGRRVDVELDDVGAGREGRFHGRQRVLDERVLRRIDSRRRTSIALQILAREGLCKTAMGEQHRTAGVQPGK
jgi:hypothetical protein